MIQHRHIIKRRLHRASLIHQTINLLRSLFRVGIHHQMIIFRRGLPVYRAGIIARHIRLNLFEGHVSPESPGTDASILRMVIPVSHQLITVHHHKRRINSHILIRTKRITPFDQPKTHGHEYPNLPKIIRTSFCRT